MNKCLMSVLLMGLTQTSFGAEAFIAGQGQVMTSPDYVELTISIDSVCYPSPEDATQVNDEAARKIVDFLNSKINKKDRYNSVISSGGYTLPYQIYYQDKYLCQNTFQKNNTITFRTQDLKNFEGLFNEIQGVVYKQVARTAPSVIQSSVSYATMSSPVPSISNELRGQLEQKALALAFTDATAKLSALFSTHAIQNLKVTSVSELPPNDPKPLFQPESMPMMMSARAGKAVDNAPVQFDNQWINKTIYFKFTFDDITLESN